MSLYEDWKLIVTELATFSSYPERLHPRDGSGEPMSGDEKPAQPRSARKKEKPVVCEAPGTYHEGKHLQVATCVNPHPNQRETAPVQPDAAERAARRIMLAMDEILAKMGFDPSKGERSLPSAIAEVAAIIREELERR